MKFAHISDTHIKNLKYHYEYRIIFEQLYETLREQKVDYIIHCGDIAHTKTQISPEFVEMCSDFFRSLAEIAPTYIILGNHDGNLKNSSRQDALTPIVDALDMPTLHLLKNSGETYLNDDFCLNVLSVFDRDNWINPSDPDKINIALYHGSISNCKTDTNWTMSFGEDDISIFDEFDNLRLDLRGRHSGYLDISSLGRHVLTLSGSPDSRVIALRSIAADDSYRDTQVISNHLQIFCQLLNVFHQLFWYVGSVPAAKLTQVKILS